MPQNGIFPKDRTYRAFFAVLHKRNFFWMVPKGLNAFRSFVHAAESPVSFSSFFWPEGRPQNGGFFHLIDKIADFLHNRLFFLIAPRDLH